MTMDPQRTSGRDPGSGYAQLRAVTNGVVELDDVDWAWFSACFRPLHLAKGEYWLHAGDVCDHVCFIVKGLIHSYDISDGEVMTGEFFFENTYATNYISFLTRQPSRRYLQALEETDVLTFSYEDMQRFYDVSKNAERLGRRLAELIYVRYDLRAFQFVSKPPEQRYLDLLKERPNVLQRVPQKLIASYLGVKPETLSRIRKRLVKG